MLINVNINIIDLDITKILQNLLNFTLLIQLQFAREACAYIHLTFGIKPASNHFNNNSSYFNTPIIHLLVAS